MIGWVKRHKILTVLLVLIILGRSAFYVAEVIWFKSLIPNAIETEWWPIAIDGDDGLLAGCGSATFQLKEKTLKEIEEKGLAFFERAKEAQPRHPFREMKARYYGEWKETPMHITRDFGYRGVGGCDSSFSEDRKKAVLEALNKPGNYYTRREESGWLQVLPTVKIMALIGIQGGGVIT